MNTTSQASDSQESSIRQRFQVSRSVILEAGALANEYFGRIGTLTVRSKGSHDLVSEADLNTELLIKTASRTTF